MSIPDEAMGEYCRLVSARIRRGGDEPAEDKRELARRLVERF